MYIYINICVHMYIYIYTLIKSMNNRHHPRNIDSQDPRYIWMASSWARGSIDDGSSTLHPGQLGSDSIC